MLFWSLWVFIKTYHPLLNQGSSQGVQLKSCLKHPYAYLLVGIVVSTMIPATITPLHGNVWNNLDCWLLELLSYHIHLWPWSLYPFFPLMWFSNNKKEKEKQCCLVVTGNNVLSNQNDVYIHNIQFKLLIQPKKKKFKLLSLSMTLIALKDDMHPPLSFAISCS